MYKIKKQLNAPRWVRPIRHEAESYVRVHKRFDKVANKKFYEIIKIEE